MGMKDIEDYFNIMTIIITYARKNDVINPEKVKEIQNLLQITGYKIYDAAKNIALPKTV